MKGPSRARASIAHNYSNLIRASGSCKPVSQKHENRTANHNVNPLHHINARASHACVGSSAVINGDVDPRHRCQGLEAKTPASMQTPATQEAAAVGRARSELEGFAVRLRRSIAAAAASTVTSTEVLSVKLRPIVIAIDKPLVFWDAAGRELGPNLAQQGVGEEAPI